MCTSCRGFDEFRRHNPPGGPLGGPPLGHFSPLIPAVDPSILAAAERRRARGLDAAGGSSSSSAQSPSLEEHIHGQAVLATELLKRPLNDANARARAAQRDAGFARQRANYDFRYNRPYFNASSQRARTCEYNAHRLTQEAKAIAKDFDWESVHDVYARTAGAEARKAYEFVRGDAPASRGYF